MDQPLARRRVSTRWGQMVVGVAIAALVLVGFVIVGGALRSKSVLVPEPEVVLTVPDPAGGVVEVAGGVVIDDSVVVVLSEEVGDFEGRTTLLRLDQATGAERRRVVMAQWSTIEGIVEVEGDVILRLRGRLPGVPGVPLDGLDSFTVPGQFWLTVVDGDTLAARKQYQLPPFDVGASASAVGYEPLVVIDGVYHLLGAGQGRGRIVLGSGQAWLPGDIIGQPVRGLVRRGDRLAVVGSQVVWIQDLASGRIAERYDRDDYPEMAAGFEVFFRAHENEVWATNIWEEQEGLPLRLDLRTGQLVSDSPSTGIPDWAFVGGGSRWELIRNHPVGPNEFMPMPEPGDRWRRVDPATDEILAEFDLRWWRPAFATPDHLWVTGAADEGSGLVLARIPLG